MNFLKKILPYIILLVLTIGVIKPFFTPGFFPIHDDTQVVRVFEMAKSLKDGMIPVRWVADLGYGFGYPIFNFYAPLAYYFGGLINLLGFDALFATKIMMMFAIILSGFSMYLLSKEFWGKTGGIAAGVLYLYAPYHAVEIYVRGDTAEFWAYAFIPLVFWGLYKIYKHHQWRYVVIGSLSYAGVILSHNLTAMMITPFLILFIVFLCILSDKKERWFNLRMLGSAFLLGITVSAFYWLPTLWEMKYTNVLSQIGGGANFRDHFVCLSQLWTSNWGFGGSAQGCIDGVSFMLGKLNIILSFISFGLIVLAVIIRKSKFFVRDNSEKALLIFVSFVFLLISIIFTLDISKPIWELIYPMEFFQYPWRFLIMASFFSSFLAGGFFWVIDILLDKKYINMYYLGCAAVIIILVLFNLKFFYAQKVVNKYTSDYINDYTLKWVTSKVSDEYMPKIFDKPKNYREVAQKGILLEKGNLSILSFSQNTQNLKILVDVSMPSEVILPVAYYPAWTGYVDYKSVQIRENKKGISLELSPGRHIIELFFKETYVEKVSNIISVAGLLVLAIGIILSGKKYAKKT